MNEQPQIEPVKTPPINPPSEESFYKPGISQPSNFSGYELANGPSLAKPILNPVNDEAQFINWEASEFIHHTKGLGWAASLAGITLVLVVIAIFTGGWTFALAIIVMAISIGLLAFKSPRILHYQLTNHGLQIDDKVFSFDNFRAFGIVNDGAFFTILLIPSKKLLPAVTIYFAEENGEKIVDILGSRLPMEEIAQDPIDKLMRKIRF